MMKQMTWTKILLLFCLVSANGISARDLAPSSMLMQQQQQPFFTSQPNTYRAQVGSSVTLFCQVENLGDSNIIWTESNRIISAGQVIIRKDSRFTLEDGYNLRIDNLQETDSGEYDCGIETHGSPMHQTNRLEILVPPSVQPLPQDGKFVVRKGSTITLECDPKGNPPPKITWQRANNLLPSGDKFVEGNSVIIQDVSRHHSGIYVCSADNNVGVPARAEIDLKVLYSPEIEIDQTWIPTKEGLEAEVACNIHAEPAADVKWYKDTMLLDPTNNHEMTTFGNRHVLTLKNVRDVDFGNYSCMADNSLGRERGSIEVSGRPHAAKIVSPKLSAYKDQYNLTWSVNSFLPIDEYRILYRVNTPHYGNDAYQYAGSSSATKSGRSSNFQAKQPIEWTNIIPTIENPRPSSQYRNRFTYTGNFVFYGLVPSTEYEVIIQSRNREGWSDASDIFRFSTRDRDYNPMELASYDQQGFFSGASTFSVAALTSTLALSMLAQWAA